MVALPSAPALKHALGPRVLATLDFTLPPELEAHAPPEARGLARDAVRLMVSRQADDAVFHSAFRQIGEYLAPGDVVVINTSGTLNAALPASTPTGEQRVVHLSTHLPGDIWTVELRIPAGNTTQPYRDGQAGEVYTLPTGGILTLHAPYVVGERGCAGPHRLWLATLDLPESLATYLDRHGAPIRYSYVPDAWPASAYQTVYVTEMGSAEMPSAGRAFSPEVITDLVARGVQIVPLLLHTGVASLEDHEPPYEEYYRVPEPTARAVNQARAAGNRVIAVGTTVVRALETVTDSQGIAHPGVGWTDLVITPQRGLRIIAGLLTGFHEPHASHLAMLEALVGRDHLRHAYAAALHERYLWHEFGDLHLLLR